MRKIASVLIVSSLIGVGFSSTLRAEEAKAPLPFLIGGGKIIEVGMTFDEAAVRAALPKGLEPADGFTGGIDIYTVGFGWGAGAYTAGYVWLDLAGAPGPAGTPARYMVRGFYSAELYSEEEFDVILPGTSALQEVDGEITGTAGPEGQTVLTATVKADSAKCIAGVAGMDEYIWGKESGALLATFIPAGGDLCEAMPLKVEIATDKDPALAGLEPKELLWAVSITNGVAAFPTPEKSAR